MGIRHICMFVDWENIRISLRLNFLPLVSAKDIATGLHKLVEEYGEWRGGTAYADWTKQEPAARAFADAGFEAKMVLTKRGGTDRSDMAMSLDIQETIVTRLGEVDTLILVSGDSDFQEVIRRAKDKGIYVIVAACAPNTAAGLISMADEYVAVEARMGLTPREEIEMSHTLVDRDWTDFVQLLAGLEAANQYVGLRKFVDEWMAQNPQRFGETYAQRRTYFQDAEKESIAEVYQVGDVPAAGRTRKVWAVRLKREHPVVTAALGSLEEDAEDDVKEPESDFSSTPVPADT